MFGIVWVFGSIDGDLYKNKCAFDFGSACYILEVVGGIRSEFVGLYGDWCRDLEYEEIVGFCRLRDVLDWRILRFVWRFYKDYR